MKCAQPALFMCSFDSDKENREPEHKPERETEEEISHLEDDRHAEGFRCSAADQ